MFDKVNLAPEDPIFGLLDLFNKDTRNNKINLSIGVYKDNFGNTPILKSVKKAESILLKEETTKNYLPIVGMFSFLREIQYLLIGSDNEILKNKRIKSFQTPGGTSALHIAANFLIKNTNFKRVWISHPGWPNHKNIFSSAGFEVLEYDYCTDNSILNVEKLIKDLKKQTKYGDIIVFHGCCHNPTGVDPNLLQWKKLSFLSKELGLLPLFDIAYQGFATSLEKDTEGLKIFLKDHKEIIICSSYSKNFGLYNERIGACTIIAKNSQVLNCIFSQIKNIIRANYSSPPVHGAKIISTILSNKILRSIWEKELNNMRENIKKIRKLFVSTLINKGINSNIEHIENQNGMFSFINLNKEQILILRNKFGIYIPDFGRFNLSGINKNNIEEVCTAIVNLY